MEISFFCEPPKMSKLQQLQMLSPIAIHRNTDMPIIQLLLLFFVFLTNTTIMPYKPYLQGAEALMKL